MERTTWYAGIGLSLAYTNYDSLVEHLCIADSEENQFKIHIIAELCAMDVFDWATNGNIQDWLSIPLYELIQILKEGTSLPSDKLKIVDTPVPQECHAITAFTWMCLPHLEIYTGISDRTNHHSWLVDPRNGTIYEPTPSLRDCYFGFKVTDPYAFVMDEYENILRLREDGFLPPIFHDADMPGLRLVKK